MFVPPTENRRGSPLMDLTKRQQEIFDFIKRYSAKYGYQPDRLADVAHGGRITGLGRVALDEVEDLLLALGEIGHHPVLLPPACSAVDSNMCSYRIATS